MTTGAYLIFTYLTSRLDVMNGHQFVINKQYSTKEKVLTIVHNVKDASPSKKYIGLQPVVYKLNVKTPCHNGGYIIEIRCAVNWQTEKSIKPPCSNKTEERAGYLT